MQKSFRVCVRCVSLAKPAQSRNRGQQTHLLVPRYEPKSSRAKSNLAKACREVCTGFVVDDYFNADAEPQ